MKGIVPTLWRREILSGLLACSLSGMASATLRTVITINDSGPGSLRHSLDAANSGDEIDFASTLDGMAITLTGGELLLDRNLTIDASALGTGIEISSDGSSRAFRVTSTSEVTLRNLHILNGRASAPEHGGGIFNEGELTLEDCTVSNNRSGSPEEPFGIGGGGGAIYNSGMLAVRDSTISENKAPSAGGAIWNTLSGNCRIERSTISNNLAGITNYGMNAASGGGIYSLGDLEVIDSTIAKNHADASPGFDTIDDPERGGAGGGIYCEGLCHVSGSVISENVAGEGIQTFFVGGPGGHGGGIYCIGALTVTASLISKNRGGMGGMGASSGDGSGGNGGGIYSLGPCTIKQSTLYENMSGRGGGGFTPTKAGNGGGIFAGGTLVMENTSILANSASPELHPDFVGGDGGGIYGTQTAVLTHCTVAYNRTTDKREARGGGIAMASGALRLELAACVVAENVAKTHPDLAHGSPLVTLVHRGLNFVGEATDASNFPTGFVSGDPLLSLPGDFGIGITTAMPLANSPLIDSANLVSPESPSNDQRGQIRNDSDIGAIERVASDSLFDKDLEGLGPLTVAHTKYSNNLSVQRRSSRPVGVEYSPDLSPGSWVDLGNFTFPTAHPTAIYSDGNTIRRARPNGYYRAVLK